VGGKINNLSYTDNFETAENWKAQPENKKPGPQFIL